MCGCVQINAKPGATVVVGCCGDDGSGGSGSNGQGILKGADGSDSLTLDCNNGQITGSWDSALDGQSYIVERDGTQVAVATGNSFTDTPPATTGSKDYTYCIHMTDNGGSKTGINLCGTINTDSCTQGKTLKLTLTCQGGTVKASWTNIGATSYSLTRDGVAVYNGQWVASQNDTPPDVTASYSYTITSSDGQTDTQTIDMTTCQAPSACSDCLANQTVPVNDTYHEYEGTSGQQNAFQVSYQVTLPSGVDCIAQANVSQQYLSGSRWKNFEDGDYSLDSYSIGAGNVATVYLSIWSDNPGPKRYSLVSLEVGLCQDP